MLPPKLKRLLNTPVSYLRPLWDVIYFLMARTATNHRFDLCFVITPGRSGSEYLSSLFLNEKHVVARHESRPQFTGAVYRLMELCGLEGTRRWRKRAKEASISKLMGAQTGATTYLESSHRYLLGWSDVTLFDSPCSHVIVLERPARDTYNSALDLNWYHFSNPASTHWLPSKRFLAKQLGLNKWANHAYFICAYLFWFYHKKREFLSSLSEGIQTISVDLKNLEDLSEVNRLRQWLGHEPLTSLPPTKRNTRDKLKNRELNRISLDDALDYIALNLPGHLIGSFQAFREEVAK